MTSVYRVLLPALLLATACGSAASRDLACVATPSPRGVFQGVGTGPTAAVAKAAAQADLCRSIRVEVSSRLETMNRSQVSGAVGSETEQYDQILQQVDAQEARCVFEAMPLQMNASGDDDALCVVLRLAEADYRRYLAEHQTVVYVSADMADVPLEGLRNAVYAHIRRAGYVPIDSTAAAAPYRTEARLSVVLDDTGVEGMKVARGRLEVTTLATNGQVATHLAPPEVTARGFDERKLLRVLADTLTAALPSQNP